MPSKLPTHGEEVGKPEASPFCRLLLSAFEGDLRGRDELREELCDVQVVMKGNRIQRSRAFQG